jgi:hypothetical protein
MVGKKKESGAKDTQHQALSEFLSFFSTYNLLDIFSYMVNKYTFILRWRTGIMMKKCGAVLIFMWFLFVVFSGSAFAGNFGIGIRGVGGFAGGTTDSDAKTGKLGISAGGGVSLEYYFAKIRNMQLGLSTGVEYVYFSYKSETTFTTPAPFSQPTELNANTNYSYLTIPITLKGIFPLRSRNNLTVELGPFIGIFLDGKSKNTYNPEEPLLGLVNGENDLNEDTTEQMEYGIRAAVSLVMDIGENLFFTPGVKFDFGFTDTSKDVPMSPVPSSKDTFWKLSAVAGIVYTLF